MQVDMVFTSNTDTVPDVVIQIFQLILRGNAVRQNRPIQILEKILADDGIFKVDIVPEPLFCRVEWHIAPAVVGVEADGQILERNEVFSEQIGVFRKQSAIFL